MRDVAINPRRHVPAYEREHAGRPTVRTLVLAMCAIWAAGLPLGVLGYHAEYGTWPAMVSEGVLLPLAYGLVAMPAGFAHTLKGVPGMAAMVPGLLFWPLVLGLQIAACYRRRWIYLLPVALLVAASAWNWTVAAVAMSGI